jgi:3-oxoacyl-[acyl-carrier protein] reductase
MDDLESATEEVWDELFDVNVKGMFYCARAVAPFMKNQKGAIVNLGSIAGQTGLGSSLPYAVSKAAVHGLTKSLARALAPDIRVNCIVPGAVETRWWAGREALMSRLAPHLPLQRISKPEDIAAMICTTLEQEAMTGQIITVDSGQTL